MAYGSFLIVRRISSKLWKMKSFLSSIFKSSIMRFSSLHCESMNVWLKLLSMQEAAME